MLVMILLLPIIYLILCFNMHASCLLMCFVSVSCNVKVKNYEKCLVSFISVQEMYEFNNKFMKPHMDFIRS